FKAAVTRRRNIAPEHMEGQTFTGAQARTLGLVDATISTISRPDVNKDVAARRAQLRQLSNYIIRQFDDGCDRPAIIMGDTNCDYSHEWDADLTRHYLARWLNTFRGLVVEEGNPDIALDKVFVVNNYRSRHWLTVRSCLMDMSFNGLSDHKPVVAEIEIETSFTR
ncbi:MAG: hypothetical protein IKB96_04315, partial [Prevotella sp.]|nr:hypothetical protein [Prevotella sp.]